MEGGKSLFLISGNVFEASSGDTGDNKLLYEDKRKEAKSKAMQPFALLRSGERLVSMKIKDTEFASFDDCGKRHIYRKRIKKILSYADKVAFTINPFLDDDNEFKNGRWSKLSGSFLYSVYESAPCDPPNEKSSMIILKNDYYVYDHFLNLSNLYEIQEDATSGISLEDPAFMRNGEIFCYAISHEEGCTIEEAIWKKIMKQK